MVELKPCPFCGGQACFMEKEPDTKEKKVGYKFKVACISCSATIPMHDNTVYFNLRYDGSVAITGNGLESAAKAWNRRAEDGV